MIVSINRIFFAHVVAYSTTLTECRGYKIKIRNVGMSPSLLFLRLEDAI